MLVFSLQTIRSFTCWMNYGLCQYLCTEYLASFIYLLVSSLQQPSGFLCLPPLLDGTKCHSSLQTNGLSCLSPVCNSKRKPMISSLFPVLFFNKYNWFPESSSISCVSQAEKSLNSDDLCVPVYSHLSMSVQNNQKDKRRVKGMFYSHFLRSKKVLRVSSFMKKAAHCSFVKQLDYIIYI